MSETAEAPAQHTLTYKGRVDPQVGSHMGPSLNNRRFWTVLGAVYNPTTDTTAVTLEEHVI